MIKAGTRVIALSSTLKKGIGPRRGSIGYVTDKMALPIRFNSSHCIYVSVVHVVFTRYGFERRRRKEHKYFINMVPSIMGEEMADLKRFDSYDAVRRYINSRVVELSNVDLGKMFWINTKKSLQKILGKSIDRRIHAGILVPLQPKDLLRCSNNEFIAWLDAMVTSNGLVKSGVQVLGAKNKQNIWEIISQQTTSSLVSMTRDKKYRVKMLSQYASTANNRKNVMHTIRGLTAIVNGREYKIKREAVEPVLRHLDPAAGKKHARKSLVALFTPSYYETEFLWKAKILFSNNNMFKTQEIINMFSTATNELRCLARSLEKGTGTQ